MIRDGEAKDFDHNGVRMVSFPRVLMGSRESNKSVQQATRSKCMAQGSFAKLQEMFEGLGWEVMKKPLANEPTVLINIATYTVQLLGLCDHHIVCSTQPQTASLNIIPLIEFTSIMFYNVPGVLDEQRRAMGRRDG